MAAPKLRFKGFNDDWEEALLTDIVHFYNGKGHEGVVDENGEYILINSKFISSDRAVFKRVSECHQKVFDDSLVMVMSDVPNGKALAKFIHIVDGKEYALNQRIGMLVFKEEFSSKFYQYPLNRNKYYLAFDSGVGQTNLRKDEVLECPIYKLSLREQTKIASFLSAVDEKISQLTQKHELLSQYKQGMMQKLFSQQIRFKADDGSEFGEWEDKILGDVIKFYNGKGHENNVDPNGDFVLINSKFVSSDTATFKKVDICNQKVFDDCLVMVMSDVPNGKALAKVLHISDGSKFALNQRIGMFIFSKENYPKFFQYQLNRHKYYLSFDSGVGQTNLKKEDVLGCPTFIPCLEEQTKIANFLSSIDQKTEVVAQQIEQAKLWKKGLLQQMFV